jgi:hypothetical protein
VTLIQYFAAWRAVILRFLFLQRHGRRDIELFADLFAMAEMGVPHWQSLLPHDFHIWLRRVERQLSLEADFPAGTRLGTFRHSPVLQLGDLIAGDCAFGDARWKHTEQDLRSRTRLKPYFNPQIDEVVDLDPEMERHGGYSVRRFISMLRFIAHQDPVAVALLLSKEFERCAAHWACRRGADGLLDLTSIANDQRILLLSGIALADHERLLAIVRALHADRNLDAKGLQEALEDVETGQPISNPAYRAYLETACLNVPALATIAYLRRVDRLAMLREIVRVVTPTVDGKGGDRARRELSQYYGLTWKRLLALGSLEIVTTTSDLLKRPCQRNDLSRETRTEDRAVGLAGKIITCIVTQERWPVWTWSEARRMIKIARRHYVRATFQAGGGGRIDPRCWLNTEQDARLFRKLSQPRRVKISNRKGGKRDGFFSRQLRARNRLLLTFFGAAGRPVAHHQMRRADLATQAMSHMAAAHSPFTCDPVFIPMALHQLNVNGYQSTRGKNAAKKRFDLQVSAGPTALGCRLARPHDAPLRVPDFPPEGKITVEVINAWTADPGNDQSPP